MEDDEIKLHKGAIAFSDALIQGSAELSEEDQARMTSSGKPILDHQNEEEFLTAYVEFYHSLLEEEVES